MNKVFEGKTNISIDKYMAMPYTKTLTKTDLGTFFAKVMEIPDCIAEGKTPEEAFDLLDVSLKYYFKDAIANERTIPTPIEIEKYSGKFVVRLAPTVHYQLAKSALQKDTSLNQVVMEAIDSYLMQKVY
ncbi:MAG: type II toxin-antitoxin system HicB family antitoxin [Oscillospiraceae bacterium]|nr:type II toxin-antitoxin system HicB family antitoxin [Oscillospiraceae bacterium]